MVNSDEKVLSMKVCSTVNIDTNLHGQSEAPFHRIKMYFSQSSLRADWELTD